jgi:hypothetical protein
VKKWGRSTGMGYESHQAPNEENTRSPRCPNVGKRQGHENIQKPKGRQKEKILCNSQQQQKR